MDDYTKSKLEEFVEDRDLDVEDVKEPFEEELVEIQSKEMETLDEKTQIDFAVSALSARDLRDRRVGGGSGTSMEIKILAIGHRGVWEDWGQDDVDTSFAHAIIHGPLPDENGEPGEERAAKAILLNHETNMDLLEVQSKFYAGNTLEATYEVEQAWDLDGFYRCYSSEQTELVEKDIDDLPSDRDEKNDLLRKMFPDVRLSDLARDGEGLSSYDPSSDGNYPHDFGADIKRFRGTIQDYYIPDDRSFGIYTLMDDSVTEEDLEDTRVDSDNQNLPGLTVFCQPDYHMQYGNLSIVDVYGVMELDSDGEIVMRAAGIVPIVPREMEDGDDETEVEATEGTI